jgi:glycosyltransferase involved in cell wall biosynthesis
MEHFYGRVPVWFRGDSTLLDHRAGWAGSIKRSVRKLVLKWVYRHIDVAFYVGHANKAYYEWVGLKKQNLYFAPHAIDISRFSANRHTEVESLMQDLGISADAVTLLFAGKFETKKDPMMLLKAFEQSALESQYLILVGNGFLQQEIQDNIAAMTKIKQVRLLDFQNQNSMPVIYQMATIFCLPSVGPGETWGLAVNEAMAAGCAVWVSNKVGCAADLVRENYNGHILPAGDIKAWSAAIADATDKKTLLEQGAKSKEMIKNFTYEKIVATIVHQLCLF